MSLQGTLNFGHGSDDPLYFVQNRFLTPIQIDIKIKMNWRKLWQTEIEISYIPRDLITVIFYYQISLNPLKTQSLSQVSFPLLFPLRYIVPPVFTNSDKGKNKGKKII